MPAGVMKMRPVEGGPEIAPGETVTLKPSGLHVMLMDLKHALKQGNTLQFVKAGTVKVMFPVVAIGATAPGTVARGSGMMEHHGSMLQMKLAGDCTDRRPLLH
jgi:copper(I)-binding protein